MQMQRDGVFFVFFFHALNLNFYSEPRQAPSQEKKTEACSSNAIHSLSSIPNSDSLTGSQQKLQVINLVDSSAVNQALVKKRKQKLAVAIPSVARLRYPTLIL